MQATACILYLLLTPVLFGITHKKTVDFMLYLITRFVLQRGWVLKSTFTCLLSVNIMFHGACSSEDNLCNLHNHKLTVSWVKWACGSLIRGPRGVSNICSTLTGIYRVGKTFEPPLRKMENHKRQNLTPKLQ